MNIFSDLVQQRMHQLMANGNNNWNNNKRSPFGCGLNWIPNQNSSTMHIRSSVGLEFFQLTSAWLFENFRMRILKSHNVYWFEDIWKQKQLNLSATATAEYQTICSEWINSYKLRSVRKPIPHIVRSMHIAQLVQFSIWNYDCT